MGLQEAWADVCKKKKKIVASSPGDFGPVGFYQELRTEENVEMYVKNSNLELIFM